MSLGPAALTRRWWLIGAGALVVILVVVALVTHRSTTTARGAATATAAARQFVTAINAGNGTAAAAIACASFHDRATSEARSGADPGISFTLGSVTAAGASATATLIQLTKFPSGSQQNQTVLTLQRASDRWLVCGAS